MTDDQKPTSGGNQDDASGKTDDTTTPQKPDGDWVSYDTHRKLLSEKKKASDRIADLEKRLAEIDRMKKESEEKSLADREEWKKLHDLKVKELEQKDKELQNWQQRHNDSRKLQTFLDHLPGSIDNEYWGLVPIEKIVTNPETGEIDETSVTELVADFAKKHHRLIDKPGSGSDGLPKGSPRGVESTVSYEQWLKMSAADKRKNLRAVRTAEGDA